jgi:hypothetical protein
MLGLMSLTWMLTLFVGLPLLIVSPYYYAVAAALILRWILMVLCIRKLVRQAGIRFNLVVIPVLDFLYPIYYISTGLVTLFTRKVRWKK